MNDDAVHVYYPGWVQLISVLGVPALTVASIWLMSRPLWEESIGRGQFLVGVAFGAAVLYQCSIGWLALRHIGLRLLVKESGVELFYGKTCRKVRWEELAVPKKFSFATSTRFDLKNGETLFYAFDNMTNIDILKECAGRAKNGESA